MRIKERSRQLRGDLTKAERLLWSKIRMRQIEECWFYRQKPIGKYVADFYCPRAKLVIEVDGGQHFAKEKVEYDRIRDEYMGSLGLKVLRFNNVEVMKNIEGVVERIELEVLSKIPLNPPLRKGETGRRASEGKC
jgi:very-short-patch-repair endonuclease